MYYLWEKLLSNLNVTSLERPPRVPYGKVFLCYETHSVMVRFGPQHPVYGASDYYLLVDSCPLHRKAKGYTYLGDITFASPALCMTDSTYILNICWTSKWTLLQQKEALGVLKGFSIGLFQSLLRTAKTSSFIYKVRNYKNRTQWAKYTSLKWGFFHINKAITDPQRVTYLKICF